jgi:rhodanese-related sulfurtransferase
MYKTVMMNDVEQLMKKGEVHVLDVRESEEFEEGHIPGALMTPISEFMKYLPKIDKHFLLSKFFKALLFC